MSICGSTNTSSGEPCQRQVSNGQCSYHSNEMQTNRDGTFGLNPSRASFANTAGVSFDGDRDLYDVLGYPEKIDFTDYWSSYMREGIGKRVVDAAANTTWRRQPKIVSDDLEDDEDAKNDSFFQSWESLRREHRIIHKMTKADKMARIGEFSVMVLGFDDATTDDDFENEVSGNTNLEYISVFHQGDVEDISIDSDPMSERFGQPESYLIDFSTEEDAGDDGGTFEVHHSRVIHIAEDTLDSEIFGIPVMKPIFNYIIGVEHTVGGAQESYWRIADRGMHLDIDPDLGDVDTDDLQDQVQAYQHNMQRFLRTIGVDIETLGGEDVNPENLFDVLLTMITTAREDIPPKRILTGSERGELASTQDESNWLAIISARQKDHAGPNIVRPFVDKMQDTNNLPDTEYKISWPSLFELNELEKAEVAQTKANAIKALSDASLNNPSVDDDIMEKVTGLDFGDDTDINEQLDTEDEDILDQFESNGTKEAV